MTVPEAVIQVPAFPLVELVSVELTWVVLAKAAFPDNATGRGLFQPESCPQYHPEHTQAGFDTT